MTTLSRTLADWMTALAWEDIPADLIEHAKLRVLDTLGVTLAASTLEYGAVMRNTVADIENTGTSSLLGSGQKASAPWAALANGMLAHALIFDDTHNESIVHPSSPLVSTAFAVGQAMNASGRDFLLGIIGGSELACRVGLLAEGEFHRVGFQPTAIAAPFGCAYAAARLYGLDAGKMAHAAGITGSMAAGINESWSDGAWAQLMHPGWGAHSGISAALLAKSGYTGPSTVFEGRFGVLRTHVQKPDFNFRFERLESQLGERWESRNISFKPYPCAHVIHPFLDALMALRREGLRADQVRRIVCPIAGYMVRIVCEPLSEKRRPLTPAQARTSLQYTLAEALHLGRLDATSYAASSMQDASILELAGRIEYVIDDTAPDSRAFKGWVIVETQDGRRLEMVEPFTRGSQENPMSAEDVAQKFRLNAALLFPEERVEEIIQATHRLDTMPLESLARLCVLP